MRRSFIGDLSLENYIMELHCGRTLWMYSVDLCVDQGSDRQWMHVDARSMKSYGEYEVAGCIKVY